MLDETAFAVEGGSIDTIICTVYGDEPQSVKWIDKNGDTIQTNSGNGETLTSGRYISGSFSQEIKLDLSDTKSSRDYYCKAEWDNKELHAKTSVEVFGKYSLCLYYISF